MKSYSVLFSVLLLSTAKLSAQYISSTTVQAGSPVVYPNTVNNVILRIEVEIGSGPVTLTNMEFSTNGASCPMCDISNAKLYHYNDSSSFNVTAAVLIGTYSNPWSTVFTFLGQSSNYFGMSSYSNMTPGQKNYFWLTYNLQAGALVCDVLDAEFNSVIVNGQSYAPTLMGPAGFSIIGACGVGLNEANSTGDLKVFPIPSYNEITVSMNEGSNDPLTISLFALNGTKIATLFNQIPPVYPFELDFSLADYPNGIYYLDIVQGDSVRKTKIVKL